MTSVMKLSEVVDVVIGVDTHVATHAAAAVDARTGGVLAQITVNADAEGYAELVDFADRVGEESGALRAWAIEVGLPVGVSFFTFESMSYVIDVYRKELEPHESYLEYLTFVAFFPHLVAGPIVRPRDLLPQLAGAPRFDHAGQELLGHFGSGKKRGRYQCEGRDLRRIVRGEARRH